MMTRSPLGVKIVRRKHRPIGLQFRFPAGAGPERPLGEMNFINGSGKGDIVGVSGNIRFDIPGRGKTGQYKQSKQSANRQIKIFSWSFSFN